MSVIEAPNDDGGHELILAWAAQLEGEPAWAIESSATFARVFLRRLLREGRPVLESPAHLTPRQGRRSRRPDESDRDDAIAIARSALGEDKPLPPPRRDDRTALLKILITERDGVEAHVTRVRNRIHAHLVALPGEVRGRIGNLITKSGIRSARAFDMDTGGVDAARAASIRRLGRQLEQLWEHSRELHAEIRREIRAMGASLTDYAG